VGHADAIWHSRRAIEHGGATSHGPTDADIRADRHTAVKHPLGALSSLAEPVVVQRFE
jgi:hypothetical protein